MKPHKNIEAIYPLSHTQQGMLFHTLYAPESSMYFEQFICTLAGSFNRHAFKQAWQQVMERHPVLRSLVFLKKGNKPLQVVRQQVKLPWTEHDWRSSASNEHLDNFLKQDREQGFVLDQAPLMRCAIIQVADDRYRFVWSHHHLLMDGWCLPIIFKEVFTFYNAFCQEQEIHLPKPRPYRDYIAWLQKQDMAKAETFWKAQLHGLTAPTPFRVDTVFDNEPENYEEQTLTLSTETTATLQSLVRTHHVTLNTFVQGAWALLLSRYSGFDDVIFGATVSGRPADLTGVESMVGLFINTLPIRVFVAPKQLLKPWLSKLHTQQAECEQYSYTPLVSIQGWSEIPGGISLFESIVVFENYPFDKSLSDIGSLAISEVQTIEKTNYPLTLTVSMLTGELEFKISYLSNRFEAFTVNRMIGHLKTLLEGMINQPETRKLGEIPLLTETEQQQLLSWNETATDYPRDKTIVDLFEQQVEKTPEHIAVIFEDQQLTYQALNTKANRLGQLLQEKGIGRGKYVPVLMTRSVEIPIAFLAIMKSGAAFVPIDIHWPMDRIQMVISQLNSPVILMNRGCPELSFLSHQEAIVVETETMGHLKPNLEISVSADDPIYVIYTSGSTGEPKGAINQHRGIVNRFWYMNQTYNCFATDVILQTTPHHFDSAVWQLFWPLINGARTVIPSESLGFEPKLMLELIARQQVTITDFVPAILDKIVEQLSTDVASPAQIHSLRQLVIGGEAINPQTVCHLKAAFPQLGITNAYGPTETSIGVIFYEVENPCPKTIPIGKPIANVKALILDKQLNFVPIGVPGELYIGGVCVGLGYFNNEAETKASFISNPFEALECDRLYKTGDLARFSDDGNIEYLDRIDNQVKIRGFRIELGEIEAVLAQHPVVRENAVVVHESSKTDKRLIAYWVPTLGQVIENAELRDFLKQRLPDYMIPSAFVMLEALPLTPNGKLDRRALSKQSVDNY